MTLTKRGVVSLSGMDKFAKVSCYPNGIVRVILSRGAPIASSIHEMYPKRSVLVIDREIFGPCKLHTKQKTPGETDEERAYRTASDKFEQFADAFLVIESVTGTPLSAAIIGTPTTFFSLFAKARVLVLPFSSGIRRPRSSSRALIPISRRSANLDFESDLLSLVPLILRLPGRGSSTGKFMSFRANWDARSVDVEFKFINQWSLNVNVDARLSANIRLPGAASLFTKTWELLSEPLYGLPKIDFLKKFDDENFSFPSMKLGFYFEIPLLVRVEGCIEKKVANVASASYTTSRAEVTLYMRGPFTNLDIGTSTKQLAPSRSSFDFTPTFTAAQPTQVQFLLFVGISPQFVAYALIFQSRVSIEAGVEIEGIWDAQRNTGLPPLPSPSNGVQFGRCDKCHEVQIAGRGIIQNAGIYAQIGLEIEITRFWLNITVPIRKTLAKIQFPGNPSLSVDIATGCYIESCSSTGVLNYIAKKDVCEECPATQPRYNPTRQECEEDCKDPKKPFFNQATRKCEACPPETPAYNRQLQICEGQCPGGTRAGNDVPFYGSFKLGKPSRNFVFYRKHYTVKDQMQVIYERKVIHDTGCTGGSSSVTLAFSGKATNVVVRK